MANQDSCIFCNETTSHGIAWRSSHRLVPIVYALTALAFASDLYHHNTMVYGIVYTPLIATAVFHKHRLGLWLLSGIACLMVVIGAGLPTVAFAPADISPNRLLTLAAIAVTAAFIHHGRATQDRLTAQARRAEASERIKTDVLQDLGREMPASLRSLLGILTLTTPSSQPEQQEALCRVRCDSRRLLAKLENLLDLTQIEQHELRHQSIDLGSIARDAAEYARATADERQVRIALAPPRDATAIGDPWAMRRIMDNLLDNAVRMTPPGGTVSVSVARDANTVTASVSDTGHGVPAELAADVRDVDTISDALPNTGGTGLALSKHLAKAMNGQLTAQNQPQRGATVSLSLPAA